jgi:hypothetical protein
MQEKSSHNANLILDKLKTELKLSTDLALANYLGVNPSTISTWKSRNTVDYALIIAKCKNIDLNWIFLHNANNDYRKLEHPIQTLNEEQSSEYQVKKNVKPPGCEKCEEKDKLLASQQATIQALQHAMLSQSELVENLKEKIEELAELGEKKRKVS